MKECNPNSKFNCSPYIKYLFILLIAGMALASCTQEVRVEDNISFDSAMLIVENEYNTKVVDKLSTQVIASQYFAENSEAITSKIDKITKYRDEVYFYLKNDNLLKIYDNNTYNFLTEYDFSTYGTLGDISFPNVSNFYVSLPERNEILIVDRENQKISSFLISVDANPNKLMAINNLLFVGCNNSINVIRTGTKLVENRIDINGEVLLLSHNLNKDALLAITSDGNKYFLEYYNVLTLEQINRVELEFDFLGEGEKLSVNQIAIVNTQDEYSWLGTSVGLFRIDLRNLGTYNFMSKRKENILNIYYEAVSQNVIILSSRNGLKDYILSDPRTGEYRKTYPIADNSNIIFPL